jgi:hypothetical protein
MMMISGMCCDVIVASVKILIEECSRSIQSPAVWRSLLIIVSTSDRNPQTFDEAIETLNDLMIGPHLTRSNYLSWLNAAFNLGVHKITPLDKSFNYYGNARQVYQPNMQWHKSSISEPNNRGDLLQALHPDCSRIARSLTKKLSTLLQKPCPANGGQLAPKNN